MSILRKCFLLGICVWFLLGCTQEDPVLRDTQGKAVQLSALQGNWVVLNYWASWCASCAKEIPELNRFFQHLQKNVVLYGVNSDQLPPKELDLAVKKMGIAFPVLLQDPRRYWHLEEVTLLPVTFIINPQGKVVKTILGVNTEKSLLAVLQSLHE